MLYHTVPQMFIMLGPIPEKSDYRNVAPELPGPFSHIPRRPFLRTWLAERRRTLFGVRAAIRAENHQVMQFGISFRCHKFLHSMIVAPALAQCPQCDVLVIATQSETTDGMFGVLLAITCKAQRVAGIVIEAGVRDGLESDEDTILRVLESDFRRRKL